MPEEREDIEATLQQDTAPDTSQQKRKWRSIDWIAGGTFIAEVLWGSWWLVTQVFHWCSWNPRVSTEHFAQFYCGVGLGILSVGYLTLILWPIIFNIFNIFKQGKDSKQDNDPRWFHARILSSGIVGGSYAFLLPAVMSLPEGGINSGGAAALRQAILLATGGLIALIALGETRRKNDNDKHKNDQEKEKNDRDHLRQVRAERRERYTKAIEQLGNEKASIRTGGVYTLTRLVDDWLEEESLPKVERLKEGQVIINNLCAYIRSPFALASYYDELSKDAPKANGIYKDRKQDFYTDKAIFDSEADTRLSIIKEIHDRLQISEENPWDSWSNFEYDFSGSTFFYSIDLTNSYYTKSVKFVGCTYKGWADFSGSTYQSKAAFNDSTYEKDVIFSTSKSPSTYQGPAYFASSTYKGPAYFASSTYQSKAAFIDSTYEKDVIFSTSKSPSTYKGLAAFNDSTYKGEANFSGSTYEKDVIFGISGSPSTYNGLAAFNDSTYKGLAVFSDSTYQDETDFSGSIFYREIYFGQDGDNSSFSRFTDCTPQFYDETNRKNTLFGSPDNDFTVENGRGYPIYRNHEGLPLGCKFLTSEQKEYLEGKLQEIDETNNKLLEAKDDEEKARLSDMLRPLYKELRKWREEATTVKVEGTALGEEDN